MDGFAKEGSWGGRIGWLGALKRRSRLSWMPLAALLSTVVFVAGCGRAARQGEPSDRVVHLDPRLEDGRSSAVVLSALNETLAEFDFRGRESLLPGWRVMGGEARSAGPHGGLLIRGGGSPPIAAALVLERPVDCAAVNTIEVDLAMKSVARSLLYWTGAEPVVGKAVVAEGAEPSAARTVVFDLSSQGQWEGQLEGLLFRLSSDRSQPVELLGVRLLHRPFSLGESPGLHGDSLGGPLSGDGGLIRGGATSWRAWPVPLGEELVADAHLPASARLSLQLRSMHAEATTCELVVEAGGDLESVVTWQLGKPRGKWEPFHADLSGFSGQDVRLHFRVAGGAGRADVGAMLGAPLVFGDMPDDRRPNLLLITLDTTRFDALGSSNVDGVREVVSTPFLDDFAGRSFVYQDTWSAANVTQPSHASILTGTPVQDHSLLDNFGVLGEGNLTLAERLRAAGYQTLAVSSQPSIGPASGFGQGFDGFAPPTMARGDNGQLSMDIVDGWLDEFEVEGQRPFFLWLHFFDAHAPYNLPNGQLDRFVQATGKAVPPKLVNTATLPKAKEPPPSIAFLGEVNNKDYVNFLYRAEVSYLDQLLADLFATLKSDGIAEETLVVLTSDHGEFLGERGSFYSHKGLYPETLHVPLMLHLPGQTEGAVIDGRVSTLDITPTVLGQLGLDGYDAGRDLVALARGKTTAVRERVWFEHADGMQIGCRDADYFFVVTLRAGMVFGTEPIPDEPEYARGRAVPKGTVALFDVTADPDLKRDLAEERPEVVARYRALLDEYRATARPIGSERRDMSAELRAELEALGYTGD